MTEEEIIENLKAKIAEKGFYGDVSSKPPTEQALFSLQNKLFLEREIYKSEYEKWRADVAALRAKGDTTILPKPVDGSKQVWSDMLDIMYKYTRSCILKRNTKKKYMEPEDVADKATAAALSFMDQYNKSEDFYVGASFAGMVKWKIVEAIYKFPKEEEALSLSMSINDDTGKELGDVVSYDNSVTCSRYRSPEDEFIENEESDVIFDILKELDEVIGGDTKLAFIVRLFLIINLRGPRTRHSKRLFMERWAKDHKTEQVLNSVLLELYNRLKYISV